MSWLPSRATPDTVGGAVLAGACETPALTPAAAVKGWASAEKTQSPPWNEDVSVSELTSTAVMRPKEEGFGSWTDPAPPAGSCCTTFVTVPACGSLPVRPTSANPPVTPAGSSPSSRSTAGQPPAGCGTV